MLEYTLQYPERGKAVILRDTAANNEHHHLSVEKALDSQLPGIDESMLKRLFEGEVRSNDEFREMIKAILPLYTVEKDPEADERSEEHTSELQSRFDLVCRLLLEKKKKQKTK